MGVGMGMGMGMATGGTGGRVLRAYGPPGPEYQYPPKPFSAAFAPIKGTNPFNVDHSRTKFTKARRAGGSEGRRRNGKNAGATSAAQVAMASRAGSLARAKLEGALEL